MRFDLTTAPFSLKKISEKLLEMNNEYPPWFKAELIHYQQLAHLFIAHDSNDRKKTEFLQFTTYSIRIAGNRNGLSDRIGKLQSNCPTINGDPYSQDIYELADKAIEIKSRLF